MVKMFVDSEIERINAGKSSPLLDFIVLLEPVLTPRMVSLGRFYQENLAFKSKNNDFELADKEVEVRLDD